MTDGAKLKELWIKYSKTRDLQIREVLITEYAYLVKYVAGRLNIYLGSTIEFDDLVSYGIFGLIDAIEKFDIKKGVKFETYASLRIRGSIIDNIRKMDWVPRTLRQKSKQVEKVCLKLEMELGRMPEDEEIAGEMGVDMESYNKIQNDINISHMLSLDEYLEQNNEKSIKSGNDEFHDPGKQTEINAVKEILMETISNLSEKEQNVISLYYYEDLTLKEISKIMNVSESRISQLHSKSLIKLRAKLGEFHNVLF